MKICHSRESGNPAFKTFFIRIDSMPRRGMTVFQRLLKFIEIEDRRLQEHFNYNDREKRILAQTVKIAEEVGELCNEVLSFNKMRRKEKLGSRSKEKLAKEFADALFTTLFLSKTMGIDMEKAMEEKIKKVNKRYEKI